MMQRQWPISFGIFLMMCSLPYGYAGGLTTAQANEKPFVDPCALITTDTMTNLIGQKVSGPIRSGMYDEGDHACEYELSNGSGPIEIRAFPGDPWNRITKLHPNASSLSVVGGEALHYRDETIGYTGIYVRKKNVVVEISMPFSPSAEKFTQMIAQHILKNL